MQASKIGKVLDQDNRNRLVCAFILTRIDYCNTLFAGLPDSTLAPLQRVLHAAARFDGGFQPRDHVTATMMKLHWLPVRQRITYKLCCLMHGVVHGHAPEYVVDMVPVSHLPGRPHLRSAQRGHFDIPRSRTAFGSRSFSTAAPLPGMNYQLTSATSRQLLHPRNTSRHYCLMLPMAPHSCDTPIVFYLAFYN